jgi:hypothetical protein
METYKKWILGGGVVLFGILWYKNKDAHATTQNSANNPLPLATSRQAGIITNRRAYLIPGTVKYPSTLYMVVFDVISPLNNQINRTWTVDGSINLPTATADVIWIDAYDITGSVSSILSHNISTTQSQADTVQADIINQAITKYVSLKPYTVIYV